MATFAKDVRDWVSGNSLPEWAIDTAIRHYEQRGMTKRSDVENCAALARSIGLGWKQEEADEVDRLPPSIQLDSRRLQECLRPEIEALRRGLFGSQEAPFKDLAASAAWIERTQKEWEGRTECREWLAYAAPGKTMVRRAPAFIGSPLEKLAAVSAALARDTNLRQAAVIGFALAGIPPILPPVRISIHRKFAGSLSHTWATIELHAADLTLDQVRRVYTKVRQRMGTVRKKALSDRDIALLEMIRQRGEPPRKEKGNRGAIRAYWKRFEGDWNKTYRKDKLTSRAAQNRYERLRPKAP